MPASCHVQHQASSQFEHSAPVPCSAVHPSFGSVCTEAVAPGTPLWTDRDYSFVNAPSDILDGKFTYNTGKLEVDRNSCTEFGTREDGRPNDVCISGFDPSSPGDGAACGTEGGWQGTVDQRSVIAICCANHCGAGQVQAQVGVGLGSNKPVDLSRRIDVRS